MAVDNMIKDIADHLTEASSVDAVFGEPKQIGEKTLIPIATVAIGFAAGGGEGKNADSGEEPAQEGSGGGGGGVGRAKPLAVLEVTETETRLIPIIDTTRVILASLTLAGTVIWMITKIIDKRRR